jgi:hypothetical protein
VIFVESRGPARSPEGGSYRGKRCISVRSLRHKWRPLSRPPGGCMAYMRQRWAESGMTLGRRGVMLRLSESASGRATPREGLDSAWRSCVTAMRDSW